MNPVDAQESSEGRGYRDLPVVTVVGRPNVGKSTLFNRMVRGRLAIVDDHPGVTRDRNYKETHWGGKRFFVVDTGGLIPGSKDALETLVRSQVEAAIDEAALVVFIVDAIDGITPLDRDIAQILRKSRKEYLLVVNKVDSNKGRVQASEFFELGLGEFIEISAEHGINVGQLLDAVALAVPDAAAPETETAAIAVVGKPNVGKSSLINRLTGEETVIVDGKPGTTRDSIDTFLRCKYGIIKLVDTAGLKRKAKTATDLERYAHLRSVKAIDRSDVVVLMLDAQAGVAKQDLTISSYVAKSGKGIVLAWNKWDLHTEREKEGYADLVKRRFRHMPFVPLVFISCLTGAGMDTLLETCLQVHAARDARISTGVLNRVLEAALRGKPPASKGRRFGKVYYLAQTGSRPPAFTMFVNDPALFRESYRRYVEKQIRNVYYFTGTPLRIRIRKSK
jgi:GTP-binding protein